LLCNVLNYKVTAGDTVAGNSADASISNQIMMLVAGLVLGSLVGFLSEIAKEQYGQLESRHMVRVDTLPEANVDCDQTWESLPAPIGRPSQCRKIAFSLVREGSGSIPSLEITVSLKNRMTAIVSTSSDLKPESFPPNIEITNPSSNERFYSHTVNIVQFRSPQKLVLTLVIGGQGQIPARIGRIVLNSSDEKLVVLEGPDYSTLFLICVIASAFLLIVLTVSVPILWWRLQSLMTLNKTLEDKLTASID
jgi:hypothetical protein